MRENLDSYSGLATYDFREYSQKRYKTISKAIVRNFDLEYVGDFIKEKDRLKQKYILGCQSINIEWEFMVGFSISSNHKHSNTLAKEIAEYVHGKYSS